MAEPSRDKGALVGDKRAEIIDYLLGWYDAVAHGKGPFVVTLEAPTGMGKTRLVHEFYSQLARTRQAGVAYWPQELSTTDGQILTERKRIAPDRFAAPGGAALPWLWWAIGCQASHVGTPLQSLQTAAPQLEAHASAIQSELAKKAERKEDALLAVGAMFDLLGVVDPTAAFDAAQKGFALWRRRRDRRAQTKEIRVDRIVDTSQRSLELAAELTKSVRELSAVVPVVLVVDDAQWADPALVSLLRHMGEIESARVLVVCCVWPEGIVRTRSTGTFGSWLDSYGEAHADRLGRFRLDPLDHSALAELVLAAAPKTDEGIVSSIVELASGNPLTLKLILDLDRVRRDIAEDGRIDLDPTSLAGLPRDVEALFQEQWRQLSDGARRVLAALSLQGQRFTSGWVDEFATNVGQHRQLTAAYAEVVALRSWLRTDGDSLDSFAELARHRVAFDNVQQVLSDEEQAAAALAAFSHILGLRAGVGWAQRPADVRRLLLEQLLELNELLGEDAERDTESLPSAALELAELELDAMQAERAVELARSALRTMATDSGLAAEARRVLGNALVAAGRSSEAVPLLEQAAALSDDIEASADLNDALEANVAEVPASAEESDTHVPAVTALEEWTPWTPRPIASLTELRASTMAELIAEITETEGPVLFGRISHLLRTASGAARIGASMRTALERGLNAAVAAGLVSATAPDPSGDSGRRTVRLPGQPTTLRVIGPRDTWEIPPAELEALARRLHVSDPSATRGAVKRKMAELYGWRRYTPQLDELFESALPADIGVPDNGSDAVNQSDPVRSLAAEKGVADDYDKLLAVVEHHECDTRRWPSSTTITPKNRRQFTLIYVGVRKDGLHFGYSTENLERFLGLSPSEAEAALGPNWVDLQPGDADELAPRLDQLLARADAPPAGS